MCTVFDRRTTLGLVRFRGKRVAAELDRIFRSFVDKATGAKLQQVKTA